MGWDELDVEGGQARAGVEEGCEGGQGTFDKVYEETAEAVEEFLAAPREREGPTPHAHPAQAPTVHTPSTLTSAPHALHTVNNHPSPGPRDARRRALPRPHYRVLREPEPEYGPRGRHVVLATVTAGMGWDELDFDEMGWTGLILDGMVGTGWDGMVGTGWAGLGWDGMDGDLHILQMSSYCLQRITHRFPRLLASLGEILSTMDGFESSFSAIVAGGRLNRALRGRS
ncbi:hypothetical protein H0H92_013397 [Tricholoma furcatifolium]|nr:hypothetical protein H0H92_013397 [Tricholoma furcatifolium]